ncbi:transposase [Bdellovibrio sp. HCB209]|uniref:transposase n=1 Tax=Bdellovibrio sp. HCB209 TaxID=3394354 RepID=UPI0039B4C6B5
MATPLAMPRKIIPNSTELPYHITARCLNKDNFPIPISQVWNIMEDYLFFISNAYKIDVLSFVLMSNHFHLIARSPDGNLSEAMNYFMGETSRQISNASGRINQLYGGRFHKSLIDSNFYLHHVYKYVYRNPIEACISIRAEEYEFSTLHRKLGKGKLNFPISPDSFLQSDIDKVLRWVNETPASGEEDLIRTALKKKVFKVSGKNQKTGRTNALSSLEI